MTLENPGARTRQYVIGFGVLLTIAVVGLFIVKWQPYWNRAFAVAASHTLGGSIVVGQGEAPPPSLQAAISYASDYFKAIWQAMVVGLLLAATVEALVPRDWLVRALGKAGTRTTLLGVLCSLPGMMCSCCAAPVGVSLRRSGAAPGAALGFAIGNPTLNPAVLVFLGFALGWQWAALRAVFGIALVFAVCWVANRMLVSDRLSDTAIDKALEAQIAQVTGNACVRWLKALGRLGATLLPEYLIIVLLLGALRAFLFPAITPEIGASVLLLIGLAVAGTLFVIPTAAEIPVIQTLMSAGLGAGPAGALLMTLAPVSLPSLAMISKAIPVRVLAAVAGCVVVTGILAGVTAAVLGL